MSIDYRCHLCQGMDHELLYRTKGGWASYNRNIAAFHICRGCGLVFRYPRPDPLELRNEFYQVEYWGEKQAADRPVLQVARALRDRWNVIMAAIGTPFERGAIIDVGCGFGHLAATLATTFPACDVVGLEPDVNLVRRLRRVSRQPNLSFTAGSLEQFDAGVHGPVRAIVLSTVFEHIFDPAEALAKIHRMLAPDGWLVIEVPDVMAPGPLGLDYFFRDFHLFYYSDGTLTALLRLAGFEVRAVHRGGVFRTATGSTLCLIVRKTAVPANRRDVLLSVAGEAGQIRISLEQFERHTRRLAPLRIFYRYRLRMPLLRLKGRIYRVLVDLLPRGRRAVEGRSPRTAL